MRAAIRTGLRAVIKTSLCVVFITSFCAVINTGLRAVIRTGFRILYKQIKQVSFFVFNRIKKKHVQQYYPMPCPGANAESGFWNRLLCKFRITESFSCDFLKPLANKLNRSAGTKRCIGCIRVSSLFLKQPWINRTNLCVKH